MDRSLKCCKNKEFSNFCCISCMGIFHPSCMERNKDVLRLGGYRIYCSAQCQLKAEADEQCDTKRLEEIDDLKKELNVLRKELSEKDIFIKRLKRRSQVFADEVSEAEDKLNAQLTEQSNRIAELTTEITRLNRIKSELITKIESDESVTQLNNNIRDLTDTNRQMITSISVLEEENAAYFAEIKQLKQQLDTIERNSKAAKNPPVFENLINISTQKICKPQILLVGDKNVRGLLSIFKRLTEKKYDINCQMYDNVLFEDRIKACGELIKNFTKNDFVVLFTGVLDAVKGKSIKSASLLRLLEVSCGTNLFVCGPPLQTNRPILNRIIQQNDFQLQSLLRCYQHSHFIASRVVSPNGALNYSEKGELAQLIYNIMKSPEARNVQMQNSSKPHELTNTNKPANQHTLDNSNF